MVLILLEDLEEFHRSWLKQDSECDIEENKLSKKTNYGFEENKEVSRDN